MNKILKRIYIKVEMVLKSPLCISNGSTLVTDNDVIKDFDGNPFIPGTSIAGTLRAYSSFKEQDENNPFGFSKEDEGKMSSIIFYDAFFDKEVKTIIRDGIELDEGKITKDTRKFDIEAIETGAKTELRIEVIIREYDDEEKILEILKYALVGLKKGDIRFGMKKNRGFGEVKVKNIYKEEFTNENGKEWLNFNWNNMKTKLNLDDKVESKYYEIVVPLELEGGISIRQYSAKINQPDYVHLICNGKPIVPGSSWNGAIRHIISEILEELNVEELNVKDKKNFIDEIFGYVREKEKGIESDAKQSSVIISESIIEGAVSLPMTRNKIDRFDNSTVDRALYTELSYFGGKTSLNIKINSKVENKWIIALLMIAIKDIQGGFLSIGGQTAVGRGVFKADGEVKFYGFEYNEEEYLKSLLCKIGGIK